MTDKIEKHILLNHSIEQVWQAISDSSRFGAWFGVEFDGPFQPNSTMEGRIACTQVDPEVAKLQQPHVGKPFRIQVDVIKPPQLFSFHWHPFAIDPNKDYSREPQTLVTFDLTAVDEGTSLSIIEAGFVQIPVERREQAVQANDGGWAHQCKLIEKYLQMNAQ